MTRKFVVSIILACTLIFGVAFDSPVKAASANAPEQVLKEKVEQKLSELLQEKWNTNSFHAFQVYVQNCIWGFDTGKDVLVNEIPEPSQEQNKNNGHVEQPSQSEQDQGTKPNQKQDDQVAQPNQGQQEQEQPNQVTQPNQGQQQAPQTPQAPEQQETPVQQGALSQFEQEVIELTNVERSKQGLAPLQADVELSKVARDKSKDMKDRNYFDHTSPTYGSPFDMMRSYGIAYQAAGENIARGQRTPQEVVTAWMNSPGHRANILNGDFTHIGVGFVEQGNYWTQMFIGK